MCYSYVLVSRLESIIFVNDWEVLEGGFSCRFTRLWDWIVRHLMMLYRTGVIFRRREDGVI